MRRIDILLAVAFVLVVLGFVFLPDLVAKWRAEKAMEETAAVEPAPVETVETEAVPEVPVDPAVELERVSGMLMLHQACVNRFEGFDAESRDTLAEWKARNAETLARRGEQDFHIVLAPQEGLDEKERAKADAEERVLCERNVEAMQAELDQAAGR